MEPETGAILAALKAQLDHGVYDVSDLYGSPGVAGRIVDTIASLEPFSQKKLVVTG